MKVLFIFGSSVSFEVFVESGVLELTKEELGGIDFELAVRKNHLTKSPEKERLINTTHHVYEFSGEKLQEEIFKKMLSFEFIRRRKESVAFSRTIARKFFGNYQGRYLGFRKYSNFLRINLKSIDNIFLSLAFIPLISASVRSLLRKLYSYPTNLEDVCQETAPNVIILMSNGAEPSLYEVPMVARKMDIPWHLIVDNWDNLSSKTVFWHKPDHIYVWGKHHTDFARGFHEIEESRISEVGTPRISFPRIVERVSSNKKLVLYAGMQPTYDEVADLENILKFCESSDKELVYRPHPLRKFTSAERERIGVMAGSGAFHINISENFKHYRASSLPNAEYQTKYLNMKKDELLSIEFYCVIATPTSLALEALIYQNPLILIARDDEMHRTTASTYWDLYPYMEPLKQMSEIMVVRSHFDLFNLLREFNIRDKTESFSTVIHDEICRSGKEEWVSKLLISIRETARTPSVENF